MNRTILKGIQKDVFECAVILNNKYSPNFNDEGGREINNIYVTSTSSGTKGQTELAHCMQWA